MKYLFGVIAALGLVIQPAAAQSTNPLGALFDSLSPSNFNAPAMPWQLQAQPYRTPARPTTVASNQWNSAAPQPVEQAQLYPPPAQAGSQGQPVSAAPQRMRPRSFGRNAQPQTAVQPQYGAQNYQPATRAYAPPQRAQQRQAPRRGLFSWFGAPLRSNSRNAPAAAPQPQQASLQPTANEEYLHRKIVASSFNYEPGTVVIDTQDRFLYLLMEDGQALRYGVGVGRQGFEWSGTATIERKAEWPAWVPPKEMREREPWLPERMEGGVENPLGARALYLFEGNKDTLYRIHGTNQPETIGLALSSGCIRMLNDDVMDLYQRVPKGTKVVVI